MAILGIDTVAIVVSDRHKAIRWYRDVLGLDIAYVGPSEPHADASVQGTPEKARSSWTPQRRWNGASG